jgi:hypothetical protein
MEGLAKFCERSAIAARLDDAAAEYELTAASLRRCARRYRTGAQEALAGTRVEGALPVAGGAPPPPAQTSGRDARGMGLGRA